MTERPTVISVIMPVYNASAYLREAIESVLRQSYTEFEFIIVEDGSSDNSRDIISSFKDKRIKMILHEKNLGVIRSLNDGLRIARAQIIARMDADDIALPDRFARQVEAFSGDPSLVACGTNYFSLRKRKKRIHRVTADNDYLKALLLFTPCFSHPTVMFRAINGMEYDSKALHAEDYDLWTKLAALGTFRLLSDPLLVYREHAKQVTSLHRPAQHAVSERIREDFLRSLGFVFSGAQLEVHQLLGANSRLRSAARLRECEDWLGELRRQNGNLRAFGTAGFDRMLHKYWMDTCGNSTLGWRAAHIAFSSPLSKLQTVNVTQRVKFLLKCLYRGLH